MKLKALILLVTGFFVLIPFSLFPQYLGMGFKMEDIRSIVLDGYENNDNGWQVSASRFATEGFPKLKMGVEGAMFFGFQLGFYLGFVPKDYHSFIFQKCQMITKG